MMSASTGLLLQPMHPSTVLCSSCWYWVPAVLANLTLNMVPALLRCCAGLQVLDLSDNQLSSTLPAAWAQLSYLSVLNLARNQLEGTCGRGSSWAVAVSWC